MPSPARVPAASMALALLRCSVPRLRYKPLLTAVISATSSTSSAMTGEAPQASRRLAQSRAVT